MKNLLNILIVFVSSLLAVNATALTVVCDDSDQPPEPPDWTIWDGMTHASFTDTENQMYGRIEVHSYVDLYYGEYPFEDEWDGEIYCDIGTGAGTCAHHVNITNTGALAAIMDGFGKFHDPNGPRQWCPVAHYIG